MAKEKQKAPDDRPLQYSDLSKEGRKVADAQMDNTGKAKSNAVVARSSLESTRDRGLASGTASGKRTAKKAEQKLNALDAVEPRLKDITVTLTKAANRRTKLVRAGASRASRESPDGLGGGSRLRAAGVGWYFDHRADLNKIAAEHGIHEDAIITASAVMSPQNPPENEKAAVAALAHLHANNPMLTFSDTAQKHLGVGASARFNDLTDEQAANVGTAELRDHIDGVDKSVLVDYAKGGTKENVAKAVGVLRGTVDADNAIDPHSSPKVWSYRDSIRKSRPGTAEHEEYLGRADNALFQIKGQGRLDLFGLANSTEGILDPRKTTAEDTWQGAISTGQQLESVKVPGNKHGHSPAKFVSSEKPYTDQVSKTGMVDGKKVSAIADPRVGREGMVHAWHNEATIRSAAQLSKESGEIIPSVMAQEVGWTEARRVAGKDDSYTQRQSAKKTATIRKKGMPQQLSLF